MCGGKTVGVVGREVFAEKTFWTETTIAGVCDDSVCDAIGGIAEIDDLLVQKYELFGGNVAGCRIVRLVRVDMDGPCIEIIPTKVVSYCRNAD